MAKVFVTGANGYLGGWVLHYLQQAGHSYLGVNSHNKLVASWNSGNPSQWFDWSADGLNSDAIIHLAWYSEAGDRAPDIQHGCCYSSVNFVREMERRRVFEGWKGKFIFPSSASVYGSPQGKVDEQAECHPNCHYSAAKHEVEKVIGVSLPNSFVPRFGSLMGRGLTRTKVQLIVNAFAIDGWKKHLISVWHSRAMKPFIHVRDAAQLLVEAVENSRLVGRVNCASKSLPAHKIAEAVQVVTRGAKIELLDEDIGPRSIDMDCGRLAGMTEKGAWRGLNEAINEFRWYEPRPDDFNLPERWRKPQGAA